MANFRRTQTATCSAEGCGRSTEGGALNLCKRHYIKTEHYREKAQLRKRRFELAKYGLTVEEYDNLLAKQGSRCAVCGTADPQYRSGPSSARWCVDHDHVTGKIRGLLCHPCNRAIGMLADDAKIIEAALAYVRQGHVNQEGDLRTLSAEDALVSAANALEILQFSLKQLGVRTRRC
jgi:hypothetical protein